MERKQKRPSDCLRNLKEIYMCILYSFNKIHYIFLTNQDIPELKKIFSVLTLVKFILSFSTNLKTLTWNAFIQRSIQTVFRSSNVGARPVLEVITAQEERWRSLSKVCQSPLHFCSH